MYQFREFATAGGPWAVTHRDLIIALAARHRLPAVYGNRYSVTSGGLISYGPNSIDPFRGAAGYVDRVLKGEKPADLPVQAPTWLRLHCLIPEMRKDSVLVEMTLKNSAQSPTA